MADSSILDGNRWPHRGQFCGLSTPASVDLRGGPPDRLEPACGSKSSALSVNSYDIAGLILPRFCLSFYQKVASGSRRVFGPHSEKAVSQALSGPCGDNFWFPRYSPGICENGSTSFLQAEAWASPAMTVWRIRLPTSVVQPWP
jgi:hypothetical protein